MCLHPGIPALLRFPLSSRPSTFRLRVTHWQVSFSLQSSWRSWLAQGQSWLCRKALIQVALKAGKAIFRQAAPILPHCIPSTAPQGRVAHLLLDRQQEVEEAAPLPAVDMRLRWDNRHRNSRVSERGPKRGQNDVRTMSECCPANHLPTTLNEKQESRGSRVCARLVFAFGNTDTFLTRLGLCDLLIKLRPQQQITVAGEVSKKLFIASIKNYSRGSIKN